ncbi:hypothetical protein AVEN_201132-1 [Araneus ventricosus]|uniref:Uncharacterized protein n=1 Tax=Araneus ventricosus TaxID=182803 RepID=A0A4Y2IKT2_ARAVE|nr:hypothetical protein AVEN_201132-1 [Araneus ventricosus]
MEEPEKLVQAAEGLTFVTLLTARYNALRLPGPDKYWIKLMIGNTLPGLDESLFPLYRTDARMSMADNINNPADNPSCLSAGTVHLVDSVMVWNVCEAGDM